MARRHIRPNRQKTVAANTAIFVLTAIFATPALAATASQLPCKDASKATLEVSDTVLIAAVTNHDVQASTIVRDVSADQVETISSASLLAPRAEAAIRDAFKASEVVQQSTTVSAPMAGTDTKTEAESADDDRRVPDSGLNTKLPGISDDAFLRHKKQMYRRDI